MDNLDIKEVNSVNLRAAVSAALLLLPPKFKEVCFLAVHALKITIFVFSSVFMQEDLYAKICSLSYMGDLRMLFAEDQNKVKLQV